RLPIVAMLLGRGLSVTNRGEVNQIYYIKFMKYFARFLHVFLPRLTALAGKLSSTYSQFISSPPFASVRGFLLLQLKSKFLVQRLKGGVKSAIASHNTIHFHYQRSQVTLKTENLSYKRYSLLAKGLGNE
ncbi:hypothetical protein ACE1AT_10285, partial [Pelatocladus sp. BLCC-F211]